MDFLDCQKDGLEQVKPETSLEAKLANLKLSYFGHITRRQGFLGKTIILGKIEDNRKRERPNMSRIDSMKEATDMSLHELSRAAEDWKL